MAETEVEQMLSTLSHGVKTFLEQQDFQVKLTEIQENTTNLKTFYNRFFTWFNGFLMMKYVHFSRDEFYPNIPVEEAAKWLLINYFKYSLPKTATAKVLLSLYRKEDKK
jgi:hypothetical protein